MSELFRSVLSVSFSLSTHSVVSLQHAQWKQLISVGHLFTCLCIDTSKKSSSIDMRGFSKVEMPPEQSNNGILCGLPCWIGIPTSHDTTLCGIGPLLLGIRIRSLITKEPSVQLRCACMRGTSVQWIFTSRLFWISLAVPCCSLLLVTSSFNIRLIILAPTDKCWTAVLATLSICVAFF